MIVLQMALSSPKTTLKFAAIRTLATLALTHPGSVATCNVEMEHLISDSNRSIATYAITTLLKVNQFQLYICAWVNVFTRLGQRHLLTVS